MKENKKGVFSFEGVRSHFLSPFIQILFKNTAITA